MNSIESAFLLIDRASGPIRGIRRELRGMKRDAVEAGAAVDAIGGPRQARRLDQTSRSMHTFGMETRTTRGEVRGAERDVGRLERRSRGLGNELRVVGTTLRAVGTIMRVMRWPLLIAGVGGATQAVGGLTAGLVGLIPELLQAGGAGAAAVPTFFGIATAMGVTKLATSGLTLAMHGNKRALAGLTPEARAFLQELRQFHPELQRMRRTAQRGVFPGFGEALHDLRRQGPAMRQIIRGTARGVGQDAAFLGRSIGNEDFMPTLIRLSTIGNTAVRHLVHTTFNLGDALAHVGVGAGPLTDWLGRSIERWSRMKAEEARVAEQTGQLDTFFGRVRHSLTTLHDVGKHTFDGLRGFFRGARAESDLLWGGVDRTVTRFDDWANSARGQDSIGQWFHDMRPVLHETVGLFGDLGKAVGTLSMGPGGAAMLHGLREALPSLVEGVGEITAAFGPVAMESLAAVLRLIADAAGTTGPLTLLVKAIGTAASGMDHLIRRTGVFGRTIGTVIGAALFLRFSRFGRAIGGVTDKWQSMVGWIKRGNTAMREQETIAGAPVMRRRARAVEQVALAERDVATATMAANTAATGSALPFMPLGGRGRPNDRTQPYLGEQVRPGAAGGPMPIPVSGARGRAGAFFRGRPTGVYDPETDRFVQTGRGSRFGGMTMRGVLGGAGGLGMRAIGGAMRMFWPMMLLGGAIGATQGSSGGGTTGLLRNIFSGATLGIIPGQEQQLQGRQKAGYSQQLRSLATGHDTGAGYVPTGYITHPQTERQAMSSIAALQKQIAVDSARAAKSHGDDKAVMQGIVAAERRALSGQRARLEFLRQQSRRHATAILGDFEHAFDIRAKAKGPAAAAKRMVHDSLDELKTLPPAGRAVFRRGMESWGLQIAAKHPELVRRVEGLNRGMIRQLRALGPAGRKGVAQNMLSWAREQARQNPKLWAVVHQLQKDIRSDFRETGDRVHIVNGRILVGSQKEWAQIRTAMTTQTEKAKQETTADFTAIQKQAIGSLEAMGFSGSAARDLVRGMEKGGIVGAEAQGRVTAGPTSSGGSRGATQGQRAHGGRIPGRGLLDTVPMVDGGVGAPGELIVNRHTEVDVDRDLREAGKPSLDQRVRRETRPHAHAMAKRFVEDEMRWGPWAALDDRAYSVGGRLTGLKVPFVEALNSLSRGTGINITVNSGYRSYAEQARLFAANPNPMMVARPGSSHHQLGIAADIAPSRPSYHGAEGRYNLTFPMSWEPWHIELIGGARGGTFAGGAAAAMTLGKLKVPRDKVGGYPGAMATRAGEIYATGLRKKINEKLATQTGYLSGFSGGGDAAANMALGHRMMLAFGFGEDQWPALRALWQGESGWRNVMNTAGSGATGIPQALPGSKMASAGADWRTNPATQIAWGLRYIKDTYGSPSGAYSAWLSRSPHWYETGGRLGGGQRPPGVVDWGGWNADGADMVVHRPTVFGAGERGPERVRIGPTRDRRVIRGPLVHAPVTIHGGGDTREFRRIVHDELEVFARRVAEEINDAGEVDDDEVLA